MEQKDNIQHPATMYCFIKIISSSVTVLVTKVQSVGLRLDRHSASLPVSLYRVCKIVQNLSYDSCGNYMALQSA